METTEIDKQLFGKWREITEKKAFFEISNDNSQTLLTLLSEDEEKILFTVDAVQIGKLNYLNLKSIDDDRDKTFLIISYELTGNELKTWFPNKSKFNKLIEQGKLVGSRSSSGEISISNSGDELKKILESSESDQLFEHFATFKKE